MSLVLNLIPIVSWNASSTILTKVSCLDTLSEARILISIFNFSSVNVAFNIIFSEASLIQQFS